MKVMLKDGTTEITGLKSFAYRIRTATGKTVTLNFDKGAAITADTLAEYNSEIGLRDFKILEDDGTEVFSINSELECTEISLDYNFGTKKIMMKYEEVSDESVGTVG